MQRTTRKLSVQKHIALVAHDHYKPTLSAWVKKNKTKLQSHHLYATGTTGHILSKENQLPIRSMISGPMGGDQQLGARIAEGKIDMIIFFWDPLNAAAHDPDVKALLRLASVWNVPVATNPSSADFFFSSNLLDEEFELDIPDYDAYLKERL